MEINQSTIDEVNRVDEESQYKYIRKLMKGDIFHIEGIPCRYLGNEKYGTGTDLDKLTN